MKTWLSILGILVIACSSYEQRDHSKNAEKKYETTVSGQKVYQQYCVLCHGTDGKLGLNGSKDLTLSNTPIDSVLHQIRYGKGAMLPYNDILNDEQIDSVAAYVIRLRKQLQ